MVIPKFTQDLDLYAKCFAQIADTFDEEATDGLLQRRTRLVQFSLAFRDHLTDSFYEVFINMERIMTHHWRVWNHMNLGHIRGAF